jgi:methionyl-tRNA formyltransferase
LSEPLPRIALFALTGVGNVVLTALCAAGLKPQVLVTRKEAGPYPYYDEQPLCELAQHLRVPWLADVEGEYRVAADGADILLCATYHRILRSTLLQRVAWAVNLHPSLLPRYRGPNPFHWVIRNGEARTGVTAHLMTDLADAGPIVWSEIIIVAPDETQGSLRRRLAAIAGRGAVATLRAICVGTIARVSQDGVHATSFGRPPEADRVLRAEWTVAEADRRIRAFAPFPGVLIGRHIAVGVIACVAASPAPPGTVIFQGADMCRVRLADGDIVARL